MSTTRIDSGTSITNFLGWPTTSSAPPPPPEHGGDHVESESQGMSLVRHDGPSVPTNPAWKPAPMQPGQFELRTRSYAPWETFGYGYEGNSRGPTPYLDVSSKMTGKVVFDTRGTEATLVSSSAYSDMSVGMTTQGTIGVGLCHPRIATTLQGGRLVMQLAGNNPLVPSADIDTDTRLDVKREGNLLHISGSVSGDAFPSEDMVLTDAKGQNILIHHFETPADRQAGPYSSLPGDNDRPMGHVNVTVVLDDQGNFKGVMEGDKLRSVTHWNRITMGASY